MEPTLTVNSGYGVQAFHLLDAPFLIGSDDDLEAAKALTRGWAERMKQLARQRGMRKLDTVCDLARVVRVPGSFNTKGATPVPVELLDDGGPRYSLDRLRALAEANGQSRSKSTATPPDPQARVREMLNTYPRVRDLALRRAANPATVRRRVGLRARLRTRPRRCHR